MLEDRSYLAAVYNEEVHYFEDGEWKDIDNTLQWDPMLCVYRNTAGEAEVHFAENSGQDQLVLVERDGFSVSWNISPKTFESVQPELLDRKQLASMPDFLGDSLQSGETQSALKNDGAPDGLAAGDKGTSKADDSSDKEGVDSEESQPSRFQVQQADRPMQKRRSADNPQTPEEIKRYNMEQSAAPNVNSQGIYEEILPGIDVQYELMSNKVKENVILKNREAAGTPFVFTFQHPGLSASLEEDGSIRLFSRENPQETAFTFSVPYLYDNNGEMSSGVRYELSEGDNEDESVLSFALDQQWLTDRKSVV